VGLGAEYGVSQEEQRLFASEIEAVPKRKYQLGMMTQTIINYE
jgi:hypothetical protein